VSDVGGARADGGGAALLLSAARFDYGHMDFTFSAKEELGYYVLSLMSAKEASGADEEP